MSQAVIDAVKALPYEIKAKTNAIDKSHKLIGAEVESPTGQIFSVKLDEVQPQPSAKSGAILSNVLLILSLVLSSIFRS